MTADVNVPGRKWQSKNHYTLFLSVQANPLALRRYVGIAPWNSTLHLVGGIKRFPLIRHGKANALPVRLGWPAVLEAVGTVDLDLSQRVFPN